MKLVIWKFKNSSIAVRLHSHGSGDVLSYIFKRGIKNSKKKEDVTILYFEIENFKHWLLSKNCLKTMFVD